VTGVSLARARAFPAAASAREAASAFPADRAARSSGGQARWAAHPVRVPV